MKVSDRGMRFVQKWSYACANHLASVLNENHRRRAVYYYGFYIIIGMAVKGIVLVSTASLLGVLLPALLIVITFGSLRMLAGGYHMDTYGRCLVVSLALFLAGASMAQYTHRYWEIGWVAALVGITFLLGLYLLIKYAPKDTPNKPITDPVAIKRYKTFSVIYLCGWLVLMAVLTVLGQTLQVLAMCAAVIMELFTITPVGHRFFDGVRNVFDIQK